MSSCWPWPVVLGSGSVFLIAGRFFRQRFGVQQHLLFLIAGVQILIFGILIATVNLDIVFKIDRLSKLFFSGSKTHAPPGSTMVDKGRAFRPPCRPGLHASRHKASADSRGFLPPRASLKRASSLARSICSHPSCLEIASSIAAPFLPLASAMPPKRKNRRGAALEER